MVAQERIVPLYRDAAFDAIDTVSAPDPSTLVIEWKRPFIAADSVFTSSGLSRVLPMPKHLLERAYEEEKPTFTQLTYWNTDFVGAGPFKVKQWALGSYLILAANDLYVMGRPKIDEIEARFILDPSTIVANVLAGSVDVTMGRGVSLEQAIQARDQWGGRGRIETSLLSWTALFPQFLNPTPSQVAYLTFRRALLHALDRKELSDSLQSGFSPIADTLFSPNDPEYPGIEPSIVRYDYDPTRATALLEGMGLTRGPDGLVHDASGQRISLEIRTTKDDLRERLIHPVGDYWQRLGLGAEPVIIPTQAANDRSYRATFPAFELTRQPAELERYRGANAPTSENGFRGNNRTRYASAELDSLLDRYFTTIPRRERTEALGRIVHLMTDQVVTLGIFYTVEPSLVSGRIQNVVPRKVEDGRISWNTHEWDVKP
jgi:peptide/nickel transport system substrate-binding protein